MALQSLDAYVPGFSSDCLKIAILACILQKNMTLWLAVKKQKVLNGEGSKEPLVNTDLLLKVMLTVTMTVTITTTIDFGRVDLGPEGFFPSARVSNSPKIHLARNASVYSKRLRFFFFCSVQILERKLPKIRTKHKEKVSRGEVIL
jgi:hypothetical protein